MRTQLIFETWPCELQFKTQLALDTTNHQEENPPSTAQNLHNRDQPRYFNDSPVATRMSRACRFF